ncbi:MAG: hypothetical protein CMP05_04210 [Xanthomarina sp.]|mgnify:CR=1 FL=1|uniref:DUF2357 domain-containing protein n=1 Tax=Xanthomarina sp. TaxID=1931211 RepID=UPI000C42D1EF|nr:DUF2357 domain-containing protein [Xanthomarina sp.]MAL23450.1 hypothetical protein [Xanthomarina sp.]MBF61184.1 hypothetical protein [Xanthomarina sp.]|tara:strand:- start:12 stop:2300 length:2289 start_codon:yes stop_codon:yes gene_type:complete
MKEFSEIEINLDSVQEGLKLWISSKREGTLFDGIDTAVDNNEARFQLIEGCYYDYEISDDNYKLEDIGENIIQEHKRHSNIGTISPNIFVGTLEIPLIKKVNQEKCKSIELEVQSIKSGYRDDYRDMLELITEKCTDLLLQSNSPVSHHFDVDYSKDSQTLYQKFAFIKSIINSAEFKDAVHRIVTAPVTKWSDAFEEKDVRSVRRFTNTTVKELVKGGKRTNLPSGHYLKSYGIKTLPERINTVRKTDSVDTPENRFIKHALETFLKFCSDINKAADKNSKLDSESKILISALETQLQHSVFKDISRPNTLKLNSPILQRKEGYREVLRTWLMFELAAKLIWQGGEDVYGAGKKDIATLYEYWLFFKLLDLFQELFDIDPKDISELIEETDNGLNIRIKQGKFTALKGVFNAVTRKLNIQFNYNRSFNGRKKYPDSGSWTTTLRPDYTLSIWPFGISDEEAERQELIVHVHFDAKYKIANLTDFIEQNTAKDLDEEKTENRKGIYKNADLIKMHAYKDAIRRTGGAYVLYPGDKSINRKGFHEIIPGLGAFPVRPSKNNSGIGELKAFIIEIIDHFVNRASQREKIAFRTYDVYKNEPNKEDEVKEELPETYGKNRNLIPDDTHVLVAFYKDKVHLDWIIKSKLYNARADSKRGSLRLGPGEAGAKYLLLHSNGETKTSRLLKITETGPRVFSRKTLIDKGYPSVPSQEYYLVYKVEEITDVELQNQKWDITNLDKNKQGRGSALPFSVTMTQLMKVKVNN